MNILKNKRGFTMMEIMIVIAIIATLTAFLSGSILYVMKIANLKRIDTEKKAVETALFRYFDKYGLWPVDWDKDTASKSSGTLRYSGNVNYQVINRLRPDANKSNPQGVVFLDAGNLRVHNIQKGEVISLQMAWNDLNKPPYPLVADIRGNDIILYKITIDTVYKTVSVATE